MLPADVARREKVCATCGSAFVPHRPMQQVCGQRCAMRKVRAEKAADRDRTRQRKEAVKTIPALIREAQVAFNAWIRARDEGRPCICCGRFPQSASVKGGEWDAGHYRSTGSASHLRFSEANCHRQMAQCNRYGAGRAVDYRIGLIARVGLATVEALESDNTPRKWTREELVAIRDMYRRRLKELKAQREVA